MGLPRTGNLFPTLCELAEIPVPAGLDGRSLVPLMQAEAAGWPNEVYCEPHHELNGPSEMVKQDHLKYFRFHGRDWPEQLFDLDADPEENRNLIDDPACAADLQRLHTRLDARSAERTAPTGNERTGGPFLPAVW